MGWHLHLDGLVKKQHKFNLYCLCKNGFNSMEKNNNFMNVIYLFYNIFNNLLDTWKFLFLITCFSLSFQVNFVVHWIARRRICVSLRIHSLLFVFPRRNLKNQGKWLIYIYTRYFHKKIFLVSLLIRVLNWSFPNLVPLSGILSRN